MNEVGHPLKDEIFYKLWALEHCFCQACGIGEVSCRHLYGLPLSTHHLVKTGRSDERCNLLRLCPRCHGLAEGDAYADDLGRPLPRLTLAVCLAIKRDREPEDYNPARLSALWQRPVPEPGVVPEFLQQQYRKRRR